MARGDALADPGLRLRPKLEQWLQRFEWLVQLLVRQREQRQFQLRLWVLEFIGLRFQQRLQWQQRLVEKETN